jgi:hypothetical protein
MAAPGAWLQCRLPFKQHSKGRRHIPRQRHQVTNWRDYDAALRNRRQTRCARTERIIWSVSR